MCTKKVHLPHLLLLGVHDLCFSFNPPHAGVQAQLGNWALNGTLRPLELL